jgi:hypothetical protein
MDTVKLLIRPLELSGNPTSNHVVAKQWKLAEKIINLALRSMCVRTWKGKILRYEADCFTFPSKGGVLWFFIALKHPH